ncbi:carbohydrate ABC transporter permease [Nakamurella aerolata]|uniref:Carbohydrate ABC transporter permease n=1 Tax=Nakamurella aerolata TaxID=1656892 RepID=A0A849A6A7_9ACTN|nr:carbohydrate ABC transporter permease [Nakamurella aerolata]NNG36089.1 carbohydrate ABC transporter permease [Nakamurella aerolata]
MTGKLLAVKGIKFLFGLAIVITSLFPLAWMAVAGFKGKSEVLRSPFQFFPDMWDWTNYRQILADPAFVRTLWVTFAGAVVFTLLSLFINSMAAYAFARLDFFWKPLWWVVALMPMFVPGMAILITSFVVVSKLGMLNTIAVLIIPGLASSGQMFFLRQFYLNTPIAVEEAALIDGASRWQIFTKIFLPQSKAPFVVMGFGSFLAYWNAYVWPLLTVGDNPNLLQMQVYLAGFRSERGDDWGLLMAGGTIAALPTIVLVLIFQRYITTGVRIAGMK